MLIGPALAAQTYTNQANVQNLAILNPSPYFGSGVSLVDVDGDGWDDMTFVQESDSVEIYRNVNGLFELQPSPFFCAGDAKQPTYADYDNDGDLDLLITQFVGQTTLLRNDGGFNFTNVTASAGIPLDTQGRFFGASWCDYDHDGDTDVYLCCYNSNELGGRNQLLRNNGDGTFSEVAQMLEVDNGFLLSFQSAWMDYNKDGWPDLYVSNDKDYMPNAMYHNNGDGTFTDVTTATNSAAFVDAMTCTVGDYDANGYLDIYLTNEPNGNKLLAGQPDGTFIDVAEAAGVLCNSLTWGALLFDHDHDMDLDLYVANTDASVANYNFFFDNNADGTFTQNFIEGASDVTMLSYGVAKSDWNNDGHWDFVVVNASSNPSALMQSDGSSNHWLKVGLTGTVSQWEAAGTWIRYVAGDQERHIYTCSGEHYLGQDAQSELLSLGSALVVDTLEVTWPSGLVETYTDLDSDQSLELIEGNTLSVSLIYDQEDLSLCPGDSAHFAVSLPGDVSWNTGVNDTEISTQASGIVFATVTTDLGFTLHSDTAVVVLNAPLGLDPFVVSISCAEGLGAIALQPLDNEAVESISWNEGAFTGDILDNISGGVYTYTLTSTAGCAQTGSFELEEPSPIEAVLNVVDVSCFGENDGSLIVLASGGSGDLTVNADSGMSDLPPGDYSISVIDQNGCTAEFPFEIDEPSELDVSDITVGSASGGFDGIATVFPNGGTEPYTFFWSTGSTESTVTDLPPGMVSVWVIDAAGCSLFVELEIETLTSIKEVLVNLKRPYPNPFGDELHVDGSIGLRYTLLDITGRAVLEGKVNANATIQASGLPAGSYQLVFLDGNGGRRAFQVIHQ